VGDAPLVGVIMGSRSDWETMQHTAETLATLGIPHETRVVSAHRTPDALFAYAESADGAAHRAALRVVLPAGVNVLPPSITVGGHMIHAVGLGWAERLRDSDRIAITYFGDGATSEGDFHEAMNFAAVFKTPTVFLCENNGWAISMPRARQTSSETIAQKADAYGMPGVLVDGNDLLAMVAATREAVDRARAGGGPTLIEALTYRMAPHTTTDDAGRYRAGEDVEEWRTRDPIERVREYLKGAGAWNQSWEDDVSARAAADIEAAVERAESLTPLSPDAMFDRMYARPTAVLEAQRRAVFRDEGGGA